MFEDKLILAPMVRFCVLPLRLLAQEYGADITYSEELVDKKLLQTKRVVDKATNCIKYVSERNDKDIVFQTCEEDKCTFLQLGSASPELAVSAATHLSRDVSGFDLNCGCTKHFSVQGGMGSELLKRPERIEDIVKALRRNLPTFPVTCKIRLLENPQDTLDLCKVIENSGASAVIIHARYVRENSKVSPHWMQVKDVVNSISIPVVGNGGMFSFEDIAKVKEETGVSSVMLGRGAMWNVSMFREEGEMSKYDVARRIIEKSVKYDVSEKYVKFILTRMFEPEGKKNWHFMEMTSSRTRTMDTFREIFDSQNDGKIRVEEKRRKLIVPEEEERSNKKCRGE